jgi:hypothetical protein
MIVDLGSVEHSISLEIVETACFCLLLAAKTRFVCYIRVEHRVLGCGLLYDRNFEL